ncbi:MAG TPA: DUF423 domain-containing protein [Sphingomicrobium sp.]|jgi:uncharacterized membrane protein YgdD (TMEM256/DUF423 family)
MNEDSPDRPIVAAGALLGGLAVVLGAFGAHALKARLGPEQLGWWQTGVQYQMWHGIAAVTLGLSARPFVKLPAWLMLAGATLFAATLYAMAAGAPHWLGAVTPIGGLGMIAGWALLAWRAVRS